MNDSGNLPRLIQPQELVSKLDFQPFANWSPVLPGISVNRVAWAGFDKALFLDHSLSEPKAQSAFFKAIHPDLSFAELSLLSSIAQKTDFPFEAVYCKYFGTFTEMSQLLIKAALQMPSLFLAWASQKKLGPMEYAPLETLLSAQGAIVENPDFQKICADFSRLQVSRADGAKIIEMISELILMNQSPATLKAEESENAQDWLARLRKMRFPQMVLRDTNKSNEVARIPVARGAKIRWNRQGDRGTIEFTAQISGVQDFDRQIAALEKIKQDLSNSSPTFWEQQ